MHRQLTLVDFQPILVDDILMRFAQEQQLNPRIARLNKHLDVFDAWPDATPIEMLIAFDECFNDAETLAAELLVDDFRESVKKAAYVKTHPELRDKSAKTPKTPVAEDEMDDGEEDPGQDEDSDEDYGTSHPTRTPRGRATPARGRKVPEFDINKPPADGSIPRDVWFAQSTASRRAYLCMTCNPNSFYYRHIAPGEERRHGTWSNAERNLFITRMADFTTSGTFQGGWGVFGRGIPGRVGYECRNYYNRLIKEGVLRDSKVNPDGSMVKERKTGKKKKGCATPQPAPKAFSIKDVKSIRFVSAKLGYNVSCDHKLSARQAAREAANPFRGTGLRDSVTAEVIRLPLVSPDGVLLDESTWTRLMKDGGVCKCPFLQVQVKRRTLVPITFDNVEEWKGKFKNVEIDAMGRVVNMTMAE